MSRQGPLWATELSPWCAGSPRSHCHLSQPPPAGPVPSGLWCDSLFLSGHFTTWLPVVLGRFAERKSPGQAALAQGALPGLGRAGLPGSLNSGYLLEVIRAVNLAFSAGYLPCLRQSSAGRGQGCFGEAGGVAALAGRLLGPLREHLPLCWPRSLEEAWEAL